MSSRLSRLKKTAKSFRIFIQVALFIAAALLVYQCIPTSEQFDRHFEIGRPWQYDLLTAPLDIPIYKTDAELRHERDSMEQYLVPYFTLDFKVSQDELKQFEKQKLEIPDAGAYKQYLSERLKEVYNQGIISSTSLKELKDAGITHISIIDSNRVAHEVRLSDLYTQVTAYAFIIENRTGFDELSMRECNINRFIKENLIADKEKTEQAREALFAKISPTFGAVQTGERIVDRGEIVNYNTYKILNSLRIVSEKSQMPQRNHYIVILGKMILIIGLLALLCVYLYLFRPIIFNSFRNTLFILMMVVGMILLTSLTLRYTQLSIYILPFALLPIIVRTFFDSRTGLFVHLIVVLITSMMVVDVFQFVLLQVSAGMTAVSSLKHMNQRSQLMQSSILIFISYCIGYFAITILQSGSFADLDWVMFGIFAVNCLLLLFAYGLIYIFEKMFGFLSDVTLVELSNVNTPLLMEFAEKAPGTFQHALQVSNLAVEAAKKIGANVLLVRTGALYHDIGKLTNPMLFIENQSPGHNPLSELPYDQAAKIVINHVADGVKLAQKHGLPERVIEMIEQHHAQSITRYFYNSFRNQYPNEPIDESLFTYPGPRPASKEAAIIMMADAIEAASRSLKEYNEESIDYLVEHLIDGQIAEGSFKNAAITFRQVEIVKHVFKEKLKNMYHHRISYPVLKTEIAKS